MKNSILTYLVVCLWCWAPLTQLRAIPLTVFLGGSPPAGSACASTDTALPYDHFLEGFQTTTTGINDGNAWTVAAVVGTGTVDPYYDTTALTTNKPAGACDRAWRLVLPTDGVETYQAWDRGSAFDITTTALTVVFYLYIETAPDSGEGYPIFRYGSSSTSVGSRVDLTNSSGTLQLTAVGQTTSAAITVTAGQWEKVTMFISTDGATAASTLAVNDGTPQTFQRGAADPRYLTLGAGSGLVSNESGTFLIDLIAIDQ